MSREGGDKWAIEYQDVYKAFDVPVLAGISLSVEEGEMFALFGPPAPERACYSRPLSGCSILTEETYA